MLLVTQIVVVIENPATVSGFRFAQLSKRRTGAGTCRRSFCVPEAKLPFQPEAYVVVLATPLSNCQHSRLKSLTSEDFCSFLFMHIANLQLRTPYLLYHLNTSCLIAHHSNLHTRILQVY
jgi:hypothetical protein